MEVKADTGTTSHYDKLDGPRKDIDSCVSIATAVDKSMEECVHMKHDWFLDVLVGIFLFSFIVAALKQLWKEIKE